MLILKQKHVLVYSELKFEFFLMRIEKMKKIISLPQKTKYKKQQKGHLSNIERKKSATYLYYGIFGLKVLKPSRLNRKQLEATRKQISRNLRKQEKL